MKITLDIVTAEIADEKISELNNSNKISNSTTVTRRTIQPKNGQRN